MKGLLIPLLLAMTVIGCGKKAQEKGQGPSEKTITASEDVLSFNSLKDLDQAIIDDDVSALERAISECKGLDLDAIHLDGDTFLIRSIKKNSAKVRNYFIDQGVNVNKANIDRETPLMIAVKSKQMGTFRLLLDRKVNLDAVNHLGETALHMAIRNNSDEMAYVLISEGAKIDIPDAQNKTAAKLVQDYPLPETQELVKTITQIDIGAPNLTSFRSILHNADIRTLTKVVTHYPRLITDYEAINPLAVLVDSKDFNNALRSAQYLLDNKAKVDGPINADTTPLIKATKSLKPGFVNLYLNAKANPQLRDSDGKSALIHAIEGNHPDLVDLLIANSADESYTIRKDGRRVAFSACKLAYSLSSHYQKEEERERNKKIITNLNCNFFDRFI